MTKHGLYIWLQNRLCLSETEMHIGKFSYFRCEETIRECKKLMEQNKIKIETVSYEGKISLLHERKEGIRCVCRQKKMKFTI